jgi:hypothetical protein
MAYSLPKESGHDHISENMLRAAVSAMKYYRSAATIEFKDLALEKIDLVVDNLYMLDFWIDFLVSTEIFSEERVASVREETHELLKIAERKQNRLLKETKKPTMADESSK